MDRLKRARWIRGALNAALIVLSVFLVAAAGLHYYLDDPLTRMPPRESIPADLPPILKSRIEELYSNDEEKISLAIWDLCQFGSEAEPAVPYLVAFLGNDRAPAERPQFRLSLGYLHDVIWPPSASFGDLIGLTLGEEAAAALEEIGSPAVDPLGAVMLRARNPVARRNAAFALGHIDDNRVPRLLVQALQQEPALLPETAACLLRSNEPFPASRLVELFRHAPVDSLVYASISERIRRDPRAILVLASARTDPEARVREFAVTQLHGLADSWTPDVGDTLQALGHEDWPVADFAALMTDPDAKVRCCVALALGRSRKPEAAAPLMAALRDEDSTVRTWAAYWLGQLGEAAGIENLALESAAGDPDMRFAATIYLGYLADGRAAEALAARTHDEDPAVRSAARVGLYRLRDDRSLAAP
jgi:HEAT repeat protein